MASTSHRSLFFIALALTAVGLGLWLRVEDSLRRVYHADEGVQSYQAWRLIEQGEYRYDPTEHHGPLLYYATQWLSPLVRDETGKLSDEGLRRVPILFSMGMIVFGALAFWRYGPAEAALWALLAAVSPLGVIYGSYYVQEAMLACFTVAALYFAFRYWREPSGRWALACGVALGLMHVTKETAVLHAAALVGALLLATLLAREPLGTSLAGAKLRHLGVLLLPAALLHVLLFSSFLAHPGGIWDGIATFFSYAERSQGQGHEKPFGYYLSLLWPHTRQGVRWGELALLVAILLGVASSLWQGLGKRGDAERFRLATSLFGVLLLLLYSVIPYKNPWLLLTPLVVLSYAAAVGLARLGREALSSRGAARAIWAALAAVLWVWVAAEQRNRLEAAVFRFPSAERNPYLYSHTTPRYAKLLERFAALPNREIEVGVYSPDAAWPLPWHLREWPRVGYWTTLEEYQPKSIDVIDTRLTGDSLPAGAADDFWELHGLRVNTLLALRARADLAQYWIQPSEDARASRTGE